MASQEETKEIARYFVGLCLLAAALGPAFSNILTTVIGYARRYFVLRNNGTFSYSLHPGDEKIRDQILLINAAFSSSPANRSIHVDSGQATFHLRTFTQEDYDKWMESLRQFITMPRPMSAAD
ncbi:hypothetical protein FRB91_004957, partial [Serendipita sp. 411]